MSFMVIDEILMDVVDKLIFVSKCDECSKSFSSSSNLKRHKNTVHEKSFLTQIHVCFEGKI